MKRTDLKEKEVLKGREVVVEIGIGIEIDPVDQIKIVPEIQEAVEIEIVKEIVIEVIERTEIEIEKTEIEIEITEIETETEIVIEITEILTEIETEIDIIEVIADVVGHVIENPPHEDQEARIEAAKRTLVKAQRGTRKVQ